jgi:hypothetical protein
MLPLPAFVRSMLPLRAWCLAEKAGDRYCGPGREAANPSWRVQGIIAHNQIDAENLRFAA